MSCDQFDRRIARYQIEFGVVRRFQANVRYLFKLGVVRRLLEVFRLIQLKAVRNLLDVFRGIRLS